MPPKTFAQQDIIYQYDGSLEGFLCCVFTSFVRKECPAAIIPEEDAPVSLFETLSIATDANHATRVYRSLATKISPATQQLVRTCFLSGEAEKEYHLLKFLHLAFALGPRVMAMLGHPDVAPVMAMQKYVLHEAHQYKGFLRFEEHGGMLGAIITPKSFVLPLLRGHFCARFPEENFLIYDETHCAALVYQNHRAELLMLSEPLALPKADAKESQYQALWKQFYNTIEIKERHNEACRRTHCPKRYWSQMHEMPD